MTYAKLKPGDLMYRLVMDANKQALAEGKEPVACDAVNHNAKSGCPNPKCFKHPKTEEKRS